MTPDVQSIGSFPPATMAGLAERFALHHHRAHVPRALDPALAARIRGLATEANRGASRALIALLPKLEIISVFGVGVDETALIAALSSGRLGFAALGVFENSPHIDPGFITLPNLILQPHQGSATVETRTAIGKLMLDNLIAWFERRPLLTPLA